MSETTNKFSPEVRKRAVRMVSEHRADYRSEWEAHHSARGSQHLAMSCTRRLAEAKLVPSVGSIGDSYDNARAEVIWRQRSWPSLAAVEMATLRWVDWFNNHRLFGPIAYVTPAEAEANDYAAQKDLDVAT